jgi:hypothetical protein
MTELDGNKKLYIIELQKMSSFDYDNARFFSDKLEYSIALLFQRRAAIKSLTARQLMGIE